MNFFKCLFNGGSEIGLSYPQIVPQKSPRDSRYAPLFNGGVKRKPTFLWDQNNIPGGYRPSPLITTPPPATAALSPSAAAASLPTIAPARQAAAAAKLTTAAIALPPPRCRCLRRRRALAKLPPPPPSWPLPLTPCSHQAATAAAKLAAAPALSPRFRHPLRFNCYCRRCHRRRFRAFS
jgi:hypothetical protein